MPLSDEETSIAELALDTMKIDFPSPKKLLARKRAEKEAAIAAVAAKAADPPAKKQKVGEKPRRKAPTKNNEEVKAIVPESSVEPQLTEEEEMNVKVNLPPGTSLLQNKILSFRAILMISRGTVYRELEEVDKERGEKLLNIERKFKDVKVSANTLIVELHTLNRIVKEGAEMMKAMVERFDKAKAENDALREKVKQKDEDITRIVTRIIGEYEKATLKDRYELLKEYKQGLLIDNDVDEEIELYEETTTEAGVPTSAPSKNIEQLTTTVPATAEEIRPVDGSTGEPPKSEKAVKQ
ncbi:hypothetical protein TIFTF001_028527 [Ficus carica]|uniref:Uncharacterized protein n=1 Tax=Ficus carica TaxID=3494 RepID=A0AA88DQ41_FICCA|nr:hypothetical protein TIFTF001_028527 [Ficus carica]